MLKRTKTVMALAIVGAVFIHHGAMAHESKTGDGHVEVVVSAEGKTETTILSIGESTVIERGKQQIFATGATLSSVTGPDGHRTIQGVTVSTGEEFAGTRIKIEAEGAKTTHARISMENSLVERSNLEVFLGDAGKVEIPTANTQKTTTNEILSKQGETVEHPLIGADGKVLGSVAITIKP